MEEVNDKPTTNKLRVPRDNDERLYGKKNSSEEKDLQNWKLKLEKKFKLYERYKVGIDSLPNCGSHLKEEE